MRKKLLAIAVWIGLLSVFVILAASVGLVAAGYQIDWQERRLTQTGLLFLSGTPRMSHVFINGKQVADRLPLRLPTVFPGQYHVRIDKQGYASWRKSFTIHAGEARAETGIMLFLASPEVSVVTDPELIERVTNNTSPSQLITGNEIWTHNRLVTRVSGEIHAAVLSPSRSHVFFQVGQEIRVIETDGMNELLLYTLGSNTNAQLVALAAGKELAFLDNGTVKRLRIQ
jgi:hypothetical protein